MGGRVSGNRVSSLGRYKGGQWEGERTVRDRDAVSERGRSLGRDVLPALVDIALELRGRDQASETRLANRLEGRKRTMTPMIWFEVGPEVSWAAMSLATLIWFSCFLDELPLQERHERSASRSTPHGGFDERRTGSRRP